MGKRVYRMIVYSTIRFSGVIMSLAEVLRQQLMCFLYPGARRWTFLPPLNIHNSCTPRLPRIPSLDFGSVPSGFGTSFSTVKETGIAQMPVIF